MKYLKYILLIVSLAFLDIFIKNKIENNFEEMLDLYQNKPISKFISLHRLHNEGFPFGKLGRHKKIVKYVPLFISIYIAAKFISLINIKSKGLQAFSLALVIAGAVSNIRDRFKYSYVVDYFSFKIKGISDIVFNLGDLYIAVGSILYALGGIIFG